MGDRDPGPRIPDFLMGLAPTTASNCPRCGNRTNALANGRGRLDFCAPCGTIELASADGLPLLRLQDLSLATMPRNKGLPRLSPYELGSRKP